MFNGCLVEYVSVGICTKTGLHFSHVNYVPAEHVLLLRACECVVNSLKCTAHTHTVYVCEKW